MNSSRKSLFSAPPVSSVGVVCAIGLSVILVTGLAFLPITKSSYAQTTTSPEDMTATTTTTEGQTTDAATGSQIFAIQNTSTSIPDPTPGHEQSHQAVIALPPRDDGRLYTGTVTYTSSRPIEVVILQQFNQNQTTVGGGAGVSTAVPLLTPGQEEAIALIHEFEGDQFDNLNFAGSALTFHSRTNENFTVTYTIIGEVVEPTPIPQ